MRPLADAGNDRAGNPPVSSMTAALRPVLVPFRSAFVDREVIATVAVLAVVSVVNVTTVQFRPFVPGFDLALDALAGIATAAVAVLAWSRFRERGDSLGLFIAAASIVLVIADKATLGQIRDQLGGASAGPVVQAPLYAAGVAQLIVGLLFIAGTAAALAGWSTRFALAVLLAPAFVLLGLIAVAQELEPIFPPLVLLGGGPGSAPGQGTSTLLAQTTALGGTMHLSIAVLFLVAAVFARGLFLRRAWVADRYVVVALVVAAFAEINAGFDPGVLPGYVSPTNVLRLGVEVALLFGLVADARVALRGRRMRNAMLERRRGEDIARGGREERSRLSRELHDALAQDLWLAKLKVGRLLALPDAAPEAIAISRELSTAIDTGLAVARQAVLALRAPVEGSFSEALSRYVDEYSDAFGLPTQFTTAGALPALDPAVQAELMRIAQESLMNARRHADATLIRVVVRMDGDTLRLEIVDNGRGFDTAETQWEAFGLSSMRERAALIGGRLKIESQPQGGTSVVVDVPINKATVRHPEPRS
jgi:signal transduction histidine kinase